MKNIIGLSFLLLLVACQATENKTPASESSSTTPIQSSSNEENTYNNSRSQNHSVYTNDENDSKSDNDENDDDKTTNNNGCGLADDTYSSTVEYSNPNTGYDATYTLDVEVENCEVVQIDFPKGGYLGSNHISPADIDDNGDATVEDDEGRTYEVHIDK